LFFVVEISAGWEYSSNEDSNEIVISKGDVSVSVAVANNNEENTVEEFLYARKSLVRQQCPTAAGWITAAT
jgi:predicted metal-dependent hydrolase